MGIGNKWWSVHLVASDKRDIYTVDSKRGWQLGSDRTGGWARNRMLKRNLDWLAITRTFKYRLLNIKSDFFWSSRRVYLLAADFNHYVALTNTTFISKGALSNFSDLISNIFKAKWFVWPCKRHWPGLRLLHNHPANHTTHDNHQRSPTKAMLQLREEMIQHFSDSWINDSYMIHSRKFGPPIRPTSTLIRRNWILVEWKKWFNKFAFKVHSARANHSSWQHWVRGSGGDGWRRNLLQQRIVYDQFWAFTQVHLGPPDA